MEKIKVNKARKSLYCTELRLQKKSSLWWLCVLGVLVFVNVVVFPLIESIIDSLTAEEKQQMIDMGLSLDYATITDYFLYECGVTHALGGALFACCFASISLARDFKYGTYELLYTNGLSRGQITGIKYCAVLTVLVGMNVAEFLVELVGMCIVDFSGIQIAPLLAFLLFNLIVQISVASIVFGITLCNPKKFGLGLAIGLPLVLYFIASIAVGLEAGAEFVEILSPFSVFFDMGADKPFDVNYFGLALFAGLAVAAMCVGMVKNKKIDY